MARRGVAGRGSRPTSSPLEIIINSLVRACAIMGGLLFSKIENHEEGDIRKVNDVARNGGRTVDHE